jgi:NAD(P)-dependent dehydrogenase (short-subunit alcohol dehydrogenase family)
VHLSLRSPAAGDIGRSFRHRSPPPDSRASIIRHEGANKLVAELDQPDSPVRAVACDVSIPAQVRELFAVADTMGTLHGLVTCAGILRHQCGFEEIDHDRWTHVLAVNVVGLAGCCREAVTRMRRSRLPDRAIVNISSTTLESAAAADDGPHTRSSILGT